MTQRDRDWSQATGEEIEAEMQRRYPGYTYIAGPVQRLDLKAVIKEQEMNPLDHAEAMLKLARQAQELQKEAEADDDLEAAKLVATSLPILAIELHLRAILDELRDMNKLLKEKK